MKVVANYPYTFAMIGLILSIWVGCGSISKHTDSRSAVPIITHSSFYVPMDTVPKVTVMPNSQIQEKFQSQDARIDELFARSMKAYDNIDSIGKAMPLVLTTLSQVMQRTQELREQNDSLRQQQIVWHNERINQKKQVYEAKTKEREAVAENINNHQASNNIIVGTMVFAIFMSILSTFLNRHYIRKYGHKFKHGC